MEEKEKKNKWKKEMEIAGKVVLLLVFSALVTVLFSMVNLAAPSGISGLKQVANSSYGNSVGAQKVNISGGYIDTFNITANVQDLNWKGFVGNATGEFTLSDGSGATLYNWQLATITGRIYATRASTVPNWGGIGCATPAELSAEATALGFGNAADTLNKTFNTSVVLSTQQQFYVGSTLISGTCPTLNTYINNASQASTSSTYLETALYANPDIVYATLISPSGTVGYNGHQYGFQEIVPDNATPAFNSSVAYYLYIELGN